MLVKTTPTSSPALTEREMEILSGLVQGEKDREIADHLGIATRTVSKHVENILYKLGAKNRTIAAVLYLAAGNELHALSRNL